MWSDKLDELWKRYNSNCYQGEDLAYFGVEFALLTAELNKNRFWILSLPCETKQKYLALKEGLEEELYQASHENVDCRDALEIITKSGRHTIAELLK